LKSLGIDLDSLHMKNTALDVDFNGLRVDTLRSTSSTYKCIKFVYPFKTRKMCNCSFLLLSSNLAREQLQIDTDLLHIIIIMIIIDLCSAIRITSEIPLTSFPVIRTLMTLNLKNSF